MNRKEFLTLLTTATAGAPFVLNGLSVRAMDRFLDLPPDICAGVKDRVLVIVRMIGGNDGLNTVIPVSQYDYYFNLRSSLRIPKRELGNDDGIDSSLKEERRFWLNPNMKGFRTLYGDGKLALINGVGYPAPNYSHFMSENIMFSGRDGNSEPAKDGMLGSYLVSLFGCPKPEDEAADPLAIVLGSPNPLLFYEHHECQNIEYNTSGIESVLFKQLEQSMRSNYKTPNMPEEIYDICGADLSKEYKELLEYIKETQNLSDKYYKRVKEIFNKDKAKNFPGAGYGNDPLAKQLAVVARMIRGGSKTKIYQVNCRGFDTHASQRATHDNLLEKVSNAILAFQRDIEGDSIADRVMTVTFSEFGRTVKENGNGGTDHGNLAPFFIIGKNVDCGVYGDHPVLPDPEGSATIYNAEEMKYDYRQIFTTLVQDWLGANNSIIDEMGLENFKGSKIPFVRSEYNAAKNNCLPSDSLTVNTVQSSGVLLYPNPVIESFTIKSEEKPIQKIEIYSILGSLVLKKKVNNEPEFSYNIAHYQKGVYFVRIYGGNQLLETVKIIKQ